MRVAPRAVSRATSIQSPSLNISQPVTFTGSPALSVAHATHTKAYSKGLKFPIPSLLGNLKNLFFFFPSFQQINYRYFLEFSFPLQRTSTTMVMFCIYQLFVVDEIQNVAVRRLTSFTLWSSPSSNVRHSKIVGGCESSFLFFFPFRLFGESL